MGLFSKKDQGDSQKPNTGEESDRFNFGQPPYASDTKSPEVNPPAKEDPFASPSPGGVSNDISSPPPQQRNNPEIIPAPGDQTDQIGRTEQAGQPDQSDQPGQGGTPPGAFQSPVAPSENEKTAATESGAEGTAGMAGTINPPKSHWKLILAVIIIFLLGMVGVAAAAEFGYLNIGIEKYWGAPPSNSSEAFLNSLNKMEGVNSLHMEASGSFQLKYTSTNPETQANNLEFQSNINQMIQNLSSKISPLYGELKSKKVAKKSSKSKVLGESTEIAQSTDSQTSPTNYTFSFKLLGDVASKDQASMNLEVDIPGKKIGTYDLSPYLGSASKATAELKTLKKDVYLKTNLTQITKTEKYLHINTDELGIKYENQTNINYWSEIKKDVEKNKNKYQQYIKSSKRQKSQFIDKEFCYHYEITPDWNKVMGQAGSSTGTSDGKIEFWVTRFGHYLKKVKINAKSTDTYGSSEIILESKFSKFGESISLSKPTDTEVVEFKDLLPAYYSLLTKNTEISTGETTAKPLCDSKECIRDAQRKNDLMQIKLALDRYFSEKGSYPVAAKTDKTNNKKGVLNKTFVPNYLKKMPVDPKDPTYWYGYKSDGTTFELWCLLEYKKDPDAKKTGNIYIYKLIND